MTDVELVRTAPAEPSGMTDRYDGGFRSAHFQVPYEMNRAQAKRAAAS